MTAPLKADVTAADRLLKAAVRRAVKVMAPRRVFRKDGEYWSTVYPQYSLDDVVAMLTAAGESADLLLGGTDG